MSKKGNGFFGYLLLLVRLIFTAALTLAVFVLLLGFVAFRCMHPTGSHMLASMLSSYPVVEYLPRIFYSSSELERILAEQTPVSEVENASGDEEGNDALKSGMLLANTETSGPAAVETDDALIYLDGLYIVNHPAPNEEPVSSPSQSAQPEEAAPTVLYGCVNGNVTTYLRLSPSLDAKKVNTIEPGAWCVVLEEERQFYKIAYDGEEYYIYKDRLDVYEVPELPEGLTIPGLDEATEEEIAQALASDTNADAENANRVMCGYVEGITPYRTSPSFAAPQAGFLEAGARFRILDEIDSFYKISMEGMDGNELYVNKAKTTVYYEELPVSDQSAAPVEQTDTPAPAV